MSFDLTNKNISATFQNLLQQTGSSNQVFDLEGNQITQVVSTGTIHMGGVNDNHKLLCPEPATCDTNILEEKFVYYLENEDARNEFIQKSWNRLNKYFSFESVRKQIDNINYDLEKGKYNMFLEESHEFTK